MIKQIKLGLIHKPFVTVWKLTLLPLMIFSVCLFALLLVMFNLGFKEARNFLGEAI